VTTGILGEPEFIDLILYDQDIVDNGWRMFLQEFKLQIWSELAELENRRQAQQTWQNTIESILNLNQSSLVKFLD
jgi:hypothetical protein